MKKLLFIFLPLVAFSQNQDSIRVKELLDVVNAIFRPKPDSAISLLDKAATIVENGSIKNDHTKLLLQANIYGNYSTIYHEKGDLEKALPYYHLQLQAFKQLKDTSETAGALYGMGMLYSSQGNIPLAIQCHADALKMYELKDEKPKIALEFYSLGQIYGSQGDAAKQKEYATRALQMFKQVNDLWGIALLHGYFGSIEMKDKNFSKALSYFRKNLQIYMGSQMPDGSKGDKWGIANSLEFIGNAYDKMEQNDSALFYYEKALAIREETVYNGGIVSSLTDMADLYFKLKNYKEAEKNGLRALKLSQELGSPGYIRRSSKLLRNIYKLGGRFEKAYEMFEIFSNMKDSMMNESNRKAAYKQQLNYEFELKQAEVKAESEKKDSEIAADKQKQQLILYSVSGGFILVIIFSGFLWRSYREKKKANVEITKQKQVIEIKQKEIIDSINYAKRIQQSLLPNETVFEKGLNPDKKG
jgi:tetratricopeptide (TPR) repeat protein